MITGQQLLDHNISIVRHLSDHLPEVTGDANQLEQVFLNLLVNAIHAIKLKGKGKKEISIIVKKLNGDIEIRLVNLWI